MKIGVDIDEVLAEFMRPMLAFYNRIHGTDYKFEELVHYDLWKLWGGTKEDTTRILNAFYDSHWFKEIPPITGAREAIENLAQYEIIAITSRYPLVQEETTRWMERYFPQIPEVHFSVAWEKRNGLPTKAEICADLGIEVFVEDNHKYASECAGVVPQVYLMNKPWNQQPEPEGVIRVKNWKEVLEKLDQNV